MLCCPQLVWIINSTGCQFLQKAPFRERNVTTLRDEGVHVSVFVWVKQRGVGVGVFVCVCVCAEKKRLLESRSQSGAKYSFFDARLRCFSK